MVSLLILGSTDALAVARTLAAFVPAVMDGLVLDAAVRPGGTPGDTLREVVEEAGAMLLAEGDALDGLRGNWALVARAGQRPFDGWEKALWPLLGGKHPLRLANADAGGKALLLARIWPGLAAAAVLPVIPRPLWHPPMFGNLLNSPRGRLLAGAPRR